MASSVRFRPSSFLLIAHLTLLVVLSVVVRCRQLDEHQRYNLRLEDDKLLTKGSDVKRPFGGGVFSSSRSTSAHRTNQKSPNFWTLSRYATNPDSKRFHHQRSQPEFDNEEGPDPRHLELNKRPFGPGVFSKPSGPKGGSRSHMVGYGMNRQRRHFNFNVPRRGPPDMTSWDRETSLGWRYYAKEQKPNPPADFHFGQDVGPVEVPPHNWRPLLDDDEDDEYNEDEDYADSDETVMDEKNGPHQLGPEVGKPQIPEPHFEEKRATA